MIQLLFIILVSSTILLDLFTIRKDQAELSLKQSIKLSGLNLIIAILFGLIMLWLESKEKAYEYFTAFIVEKTLSIDNMFVIYLIFEKFNIKSKKQQHQALLYGFAGMLIMRLLMIYLGIKILARFEWITNILGLILFFTGIKMLIDLLNPNTIQSNEIKQARIISIASSLTKNRWLPNISNNFFAAIITIELVDVIFAIDSIPVVLSITNDSFVVYSSNIFAVLGLRSLYFCLEHFIKTFSYLKYSLAAILIFIGSKIFLSYLVGFELSHEKMLCITLLLLMLGVVASWINMKKNYKL